MKRVAWVAGMIAFALSEQAVSSAFANGPGRLCGGYHGEKCDRGLVCDFDTRHTKTCRPTSDASGTCVSVPKSCRPDFNWVCGCRPNEASPQEPDLLSFPNNCARQKAGYWLMLNDSCPR
jgi:hypothetical protein